MQACGDNCVFPAAVSSLDRYVLGGAWADNWGLERIGGTSLHVAGNRGAGVKVGIIDSGIDYRHPELSASYAGGWDFVNDDADPWDDYGHGTLVAGIVGAADDGQGLVGVAPNASLYAYKVLNASGGGDYADVTAALDRAIADDIDIVNLSLGSLEDPGQALWAACDRAAAAGILLVSAAGNYGTWDGSGDTVGYPARYPSVIAVGATTEWDSRADFSSTGPDLDLVAPGENICTTIPWYGYTYESGTSLASAYVTGAAALLIHAGTPDVRTALLTTALDLGPVGFDPSYGYGLVHLSAPASIPAPGALGLALLGALLVRGRRRAIQSSRCHRPGDW